MNATLIIERDWFYNVQYTNLGAALFIIAYIGFYGLCIICVFGQQVKETERKRHELPSYFLETLWDVPHKNKLYQELADVERLKRIFRGYFADHETYTSLKTEDLQRLVEQRAHACAIRYQQKLRRLHFAHTEYYVDTLRRLNYEANQSKRNTLVNNFDDDEHMFSISVV